MTGHTTASQPLDASPIVEVNCTTVDYPAACGKLTQLTYTSGLDGTRDWALLRKPSTTSRPWLVCIHGHGSNADQLFVRADIRDRWLPQFLQRDLGVLTPNLRGNAWMGPKAAADLSALLQYVRQHHGAETLIFASGSMGATSNLIYAALRPELVQGVIARGAATDLESYHGWCRQHAARLPILDEIADAIEAAYGGTPQTAAAVYRAHSAIRHADRLRMPIFLSHGVADRVIPVSQPRGLVAELTDAPSLAYAEVPDGNHDSPLFLEISPNPLDWILHHIGMQ